MWEVNDLALKGMQARVSVLFTGIIQMVSIA